MQRNVIYGAGGYGRVFKTAMETAGVRIDFFIDQFTNAQEVQGLAVRRLDTVDDPSSIRLFVSVAVNEMTKSRRPAANAGLLQNLRQRGFEVVTFTETLRQFPGILLVFSQQPDSLWMQPTVETMLNRPSLAKFASALNDENSRNLLERIIRFRSGLNPEDYVFPDDQEEYFPNDVPFRRGISRLVFADCGAYIGDTLEAAVFAFGAEVDHVYSFEPDRRNLECLASAARNFRQGSRGVPVTIFPCGCWSSNGILHFSEGQGAACSLQSNAQSGSSIPVVNLDSTLYSSPPNYIKMDIEGAEIEALKGSAQIIKDFRPNLAICLYHKPRDLWEIPEVIRGISDGYDFHLRVHEHMGLSTVLYAIAR